MKAYMFELEMKVRDYECDIQGIVNNSNYQRYMEHTRHEFLHSLGESFSGLRRNGFEAVVSCVNIQYKKSLGPGDVFHSCLNMKKEGPKLIFNQTIIRSKDHATCAIGRIEVVVVHNGKLTRAAIYDELINKWENQSSTE
jgi:acyl-CoA thioester hydrolase